MNDYLNNDITRGFNQLLAMQADFVKQVADANKQLTVEVLKNTKTVVDTMSRNLDKELRRLNGGSNSK